MIDGDGRVTGKGPGDTNVFARFGRFTVGAEVIVLPPEDVIEELFIRTLARKPDGDEMAAMTELVGDKPKDPGPYEDIFWSLLNSTEFLFNH